jgi:6-phosphogluconolactonase
VTHAPIEHVFETPDDLANALAAAIAVRLREAIASRRQATLVVPGGKSPQATFERLAQETLDWIAVTVGLTDERWVSTDDASSNEAFVRRALLTGRAADARFVGLYTGDESPEAGEAACAERLNALLRPFDAVLLGMGDDGHTASLFPGAAALGAALDFKSRQHCLAFRAPGIVRARMTLTLPALLDARVVYLLFAGAAKRLTFDAALAEGPIETMPVRALLRQQRTPLEVFWSRAP